MKKFKILYVDKKDDSKDILNTLLDLEYEVCWVSLIEDAQTQILLDEFDLLITEINLDDGNGLDFIKNHNIKAIVLSENKDPEQLMKALELHVEKYMTKPVDLEDLKSSVMKLTNTEAKNIEINDTISLGEGFVYDKLNRQLLNKEKKITSLTKQESNLMDALVRQNGYPCSYDSLQSSIGVADNPTTIDTLRTVVKKIRKKTYENIISNITTVGYKINILKVQEKNDILSVLTFEPIEKKVLIVEGNEKQSNILRSKLNQYGFESEQVYLLQEAREALTYENFDYIILDLHLPDGDGAELIRDKQTLKSNKFIILSNIEDMYYKEYLYFKGIVDYIKKNDDIDYIAYSVYQTILKIESNYVNNNILLIENSKKIAEQIKDILLPRNYQVDVTSNLEKIIEIMHHKSYNMIIMDLNLANEAGLDFLMILKKELENEIPIIMLSEAERNYSVVRDCYLKGAVECLRKPIFAEEFILKVDQWTNYYRQNLKIAHNQRLLNTYKTLVDRTVIISKTNTKGIITYVNDMFCNISGYSQEELINQPHNIVRHPDMNKEVFKEIWQTISKEKRIWNGVIQNRRKDGSTYILQSYIMPILDYNNKVIEYISLRNIVSNTE